ncbi:hypothetical protein [Nocardia sp. NPDC057353]|uniref:hypothetical protein n=1 Tax=Nocardia sp. NPDC057353 TaxID=3346104 RepID=UPI0036376D09
MQTPGDDSSGVFMVGPGGTAPPEITDSTLFAAFLGEPVLILAVRFQASLLGRDGELHADDAFARALRHHGAHPLTTLDLADPFPGEVDLEWGTTFLPEQGLVRIVGPDPLGPIYNGTLDLDADDWHRELDARPPERGLVVITGTAAGDPDAALEMIASGRASWIRTNAAVVT